MPFKSCTYVKVKMSNTYRYRGVNMDAHMAQMFADGWREQSRTPGTGKVSPVGPNYPAIIVTYSKP